MTKKNAKKRAARERQAKLGGKYEAHLQMMSAPGGESEEALREKLDRGHVVDKSGWGPGPWQTEPDRVKWRTEAGLLALIVRDPALGSLGGYVAVGKSHPCHGTAMLSPAFSALSIGRRVTYAQAANWPVRESLWEPDESWWIGFDCLQATDRAPCVPASESTGEYRTVEYVRGVCELLAEQVAGLRRT